MIEAVGRAVSIETETIIAIWILPRRSSQLYKGKLIKMETKMDKNGQSSSVAAGSDGCLLGRIHFPCGYVVYVLLCC